MRLTSLYPPRDPVIALTRSNSEIDRVLWLLTQAIQELDHLSQATDWRDVGSQESLTQVYEGRVRRRLSELRRNIAQPQIALLADDTLSSWVAEAGLRQMQATGAGTYLTELDHFRREPESYPPTIPEWMTTWTYDFKKDVWILSSQLATAHSALTTGTGGGRRQAGSSSGSPFKSSRGGVRMPSWPPREQRRGTANADAAEW